MFKPFLLKPFLGAVAFTATTIFLLSSADVAAQPTDDQRAKELFEEAEASYAAGGYDRAVELFTEAYELSKRPELLFNIANAEERRGNHRAAAAKLRAYLDSPNATDIDAIGKRIKNLERRADEADARNQRDEAKKRERESTATPVTKETTSVTPVVVASQPDEGRASAVPGWSLVIVGGVFIAGGVTSGLLSRSASNDAEDLCSADGICPSDAESDINRARTLGIVADVAIVAGIASAAVGTYLLVRRGSSKRDDSVSLDVGPTRGGAAAFLSGRF